jgi:hypothetical protein
MGESIRVWLGVPPCIDNPIGKEHHMKALVWPMVVGLFVGVAVASFTAGRQGLDRASRSVPPWKGGMSWRQMLSIP